MNWKLFKDFFRDTKNTIALYRSDKCTDRFSCIVLGQNDSDPVQLEENIPGNFSNVVKINTKFFFLFVFFKR